MNNHENYAPLLNIVRWACFCFVVFIGLTGCNDSPPPPPPLPPTLTLTPAQESVYNTARKYRIQIRNNLNTFQPDGARKFFDRDAIHSYVQQLAGLPQTRSVTALIEEFAEIQKVYYEVGYETKDYELVIHKVTKDDFGNVESLLQISNQYSISPSQLKTFNPNDITPSGNINIYPQDSLPTLVFYRRKY